MRVIFNFNFIFHKVEDKIFVPGKSNQGGKLNHLSNSFHMIFWYTWVLSCLIDIKSGTVKLRLQYDYGSVVHFSETAKSKSQWKRREKNEFQMAPDERQKYFLVVPFTKAFLTCGWQIASSNWIVARNPIFVSIFSYESLLPGFESRFHIENFIFLYFES